MENITMTNATQTRIVASPQLGATRLTAGERGWDKGSTVPAFGCGADRIGVAGTAGLIGAARVSGSARVGVVAGFGAARVTAFAPTYPQLVMDVVQLRSGRPPV